MSTREQPSSATAESSGTLPRRLAQHTLQLFAGPIALFIFGYPIAIILARTLGPAAYGVYGIILSVLMWIEQTSAFGIPDAITKLTAEAEHEEPRGVVESTGQTLLLILYLMLFGVCWVAAPWIARLFQIPDATSLLRVAILDIPGSGLYFAQQGVLGGRRTFGALSGSTVIYGLAKFVGIIIIALLMGISIFWALIINFLATVAGVSFLARSVSPVRLHLSTPQAKTIVQLAVPIGLYLLVSLMLFNLDFWCLKIIGAVPNEVIGI